jgi:hypothetical protein
MLHTALLLSWKKNKLKEQWENHLSLPEQETGTVLVLKTEFNTASDFFSAMKLGDTILGYV